MTVKPYLYSITALIAITLVLSGCKKSATDQQASETTSALPTPAVDPRDVYVSNLNTNIDVSASKSASAKDKELIEGSTAILADVNGGDLRGEAGIYRNFGVYNVYAKIKLNKPSGNDFYEVWVTNPTTNEFFSVGKMETDSAGIYNVTYNTDNIHPGFDRIVVTLEKVSDNTPEKHIVEGTLDNTLQPTPSKEQ